MMQTATTPQEPPTLAGLLERGNAKLEAQEQKERDVVAQRDRERRETWRNFVRQAKALLGELARHLDEDRPEDGWSSSRDYQTLTLVPFGNVPLFVGLNKAWGDANAWEFSNLPYNDKRFRTEDKYRCNWDDELEAWCVQAVSSHSTDDLAEAVAVCHRAEAKYRACAAECLAREPPESAKPRQATRQPTPGERLLDALRAFIDVGRSEEE